MFLYGEARRKSLGDEMKRLLLSEPMRQMKMNSTIQEIISKKVRMIYEEPKRKRTGLGFQTYEKKTNSRPV